MDLTFRWLPELHRRATEGSSGDELTRALERVGLCYPLSFVRPGMPERFESMWNDPVLRSLFVDRVIAGRVRECVQDERVQSAVRDAFGARLETENWVTA